MCNLFRDRGYTGLKVKSDSQLGKIDTFDSSRAYIHNYCTSIPHIAYMHAAFLRHPICAAQLDRPVSAVWHPPWSGSRINLMSCGVPRGRCPEAFALGKVYF